MILYQLRCNKGHQFESWFRNSETYDRQEKRGLLACPECGSAKVSKAIMAPRIGKKGASRSETAPQPEAATPAPAAAPTAAVKGPMPAEMRAMLLELRQQVEKNCDYVGGQFAEEARKIHYGESEKRGIYGETTDAEAEALKEEGIEFGRLPWVQRGN
jgi:hypothetical protein